jgi:hypothetical protein
MTKDIIERNTLMAEFMGQRLDAYGNITDPEKSGAVPLYHVKHTSYHASWDWLMPVIQKIRAYQKDSEKMPDHLVEGSYALTEAIRDALFDCEINRVWWRVAAWIKWYNENTKKK